MNVAYVASEVVPYAKTGGLADVAGAVPRALAARGHEVSVVMPYYKKVKGGSFPIEPTGREIAVPMPDGRERARISASSLPGGGTAYFVEHARFFEQSDELYGSSQGDFPNNSERFAFFCKVVPDLLESLGKRIDVLHCNDWQTALIPVYLKRLYAGSQLLGGAACIFTVHNLAYQGSFPKEEFAVTGLPGSLFAPEGGLEFYGRVNFLKGGLFFADAITTVSRRYAEEIQSEGFGCGLDGVLRARSDRLYGILNGIDVDVWNPETDPLIPHRYSMENLDGKALCKRALQQRCGLPERPDVPLLGLISRLADQKGLDLLAGVLGRLGAEDVQFVLLGTGDEKYHKIFRELGRDDPSRFSMNITFDNELAHQIEAGVDIFLMPSRYEPCGLNQMYSLRYGTVPVVRATGGLADTVVDCTAKTMETGTANGFVFEEYSIEAFGQALKRALTLYPDRQSWRKLVTTGMSQDWSWERSAGEYEKLYRKLVKGHTHSA